MTASLEFIAKVPMPSNFKLWQGAIGDPIFTKDGSWLIPATGHVNNDTATFGAYLLQWFADGSCVVIGKVSNARSVIAPGENTFWQWAINEKPDNNELLVYRINGVQPTRDEESIKG